MEFTDEIKAAIAEEEKKQDEEKAKEIIEQITRENEEKITKLNEAHTAEIKTYKDSITAIISGKGEEPEKSEMEKRIDEINKRRKPH